MISIKRILSFLTIAIPAIAMSQQVDKLGLTDMKISRPGSESLSISMTIDPSLSHLGRNQLLNVVPVLRSADGEYELELPSYAIAGKNQFYYTIRENDNISNLYKSWSSDTDRYAINIPWQSWMGKSTLDFVVKTSACCGEPVSDNDLTIADLDFIPPVIPVASDLEYIEPIAKEVKEYSLEGKAYVNFPVNRTEIFPDYLNNPIELKKITNSIDTVRDNEDATIRSITLTGYASPEGPYLNNVRLAKGRTEAVRDYVSKLYDFSPSVYKTASVPEDWAGLRESITNSALPEREKMIEFIDSDYPIEKRNERFRTLFPKNYDWLLKNVYPWLRHTDYLIEYTIRKYSDVEEIKRVMASRPQNLSPDEFYLLAQSYPVGSDEYNNVFDVAVVMFPDNPVVNLNAANSALSRGDISKAEKYLENAGESVDADYARGMLFAKKKDYDKALSYLRKCDTSKARAAINRINEIKEYKGKVTFRTLAD